MSKRRNASLTNHARRLRWLRRPAGVLSVLVHQAEWRPPRVCNVCTKTCFGVSPRAVITCEPGARCDTPRVSRSAPLSASGTLHMWSGNV